MTEIIFHETWFLDLPDTDFKVAIISLFKELKKTLLKELKESMMTMSHQ